MQTSSPKNDDLPRGRGNSQRLTFEVRGGLRLAARRPLDRGVRPDAAKQGGSYEDANFAKELTKSRGDFHPATFFNPTASPSHIFEVCADDPRVFCIRPKVQGNGDIVSDTA